MNSEEALMITNEEAIKASDWLKQYVNNEVTPLERVIKSLEKQIPLKPYAKNSAYGLVWYCSECGRALYDYYDDSLYCSFCGQRTDWSDKIGAIQND